MCEGRRQEPPAMPRRVAGVGGPGGLTNCSGPRLRRQMSQAQPLRHLVEGRVAVL